MKGAGTYRNQKQQIPGTGTCMHPWRVSLACTLHSQTLKSGQDEVAAKA